MSSDEYNVKNIGFLGGVSLLFSSISGPGLVVIPLAFQSAGWFITLLTFAIVSCLTCLAGLFLIEAVSKYPENAGFQRNVELTTLVYHFYGKKWYNIMLFCLYCSMQSSNIGSIVISAQTFDTLMVSLAGSSCGLQLSPSIDWVCVYDQSENSSPFNGIMLFTYGFLILILVVSPLLFMDMNDSVVVQFLSTLIVLGCILSWLANFITGGLSNPLPAVGPDLSQVVGSVLLNYAFVTTVPSWLAVKHPKVDSRKSVIVSVFGSTLIYIIIGIFGSLHTPFSENSNILSVLNNPATNILFTFFSLITTIPVYLIIIRSNLVQARVCGRGWAIFWSAIVPFIISSTLLTGSYINVFLTYSSLVFTSMSNFIAPLMIYIFLKDRQSDDIISKISEVQGVDEIGDDEVNLGDDFRLSVDLNELKKSPSTRVGISLSEMIKNKQASMEAISGTRSSKGSAGSSLKPTSKMYSSLMANSNEASVIIEEEEEEEEISSGSNESSNNNMQMQNIPNVVIESNSGEELRTKPLLSTTLPPISNRPIMLTAFSTGGSAQKRKFSDSSDDAPSVTSNPIVVKNEIPKITVGSLQVNSSARTGLITPSQSPEAAMKKRISSSFNKNLTKMAPGFFLDPYYGQRIQFFKDLPLIDTSVLNKVPEGMKPFTALPDKFNPWLVAIVSLGIMIILFLLMVIINIVQLS